LSVCPTSQCSVCNVEIGRLRHIFDIICQPSGGWLATLRKHLALVESWDRHCWCLSNRLALSYCWCARRNVAVECIRGFAVDTSTVCMLCSSSTRSCGTSTFSGGNYDNRCCISKSMSVTSRCVCVCMCVSVYLWVCGWEGVGVCVSVSECMCVRLFVQCK